MLSDVWSGGIVDMSLGVGTTGVWDGVKIDSLTALLVGDGVDLLMDGGIAVLIAVAIALDFGVVIALEFAMSAYDRVWLVVDVMSGALACVCADPVTGVAPEISAEVLTAVTVNIVAAVVTALGFTMSVSLKYRLRFC